MGFLDSLKKALGGKSTTSSGGGRSGFGDESWVYWIHVQCKKCLDVWDAEVAPESWSMPVLSSCPDFQVTGVRLIFEGYCSQCRHEENEPGE